MGRGFTKAVKNAEMQGVLKQIPPDAAQAMGQTNTLLGNIVKASGVATPVVQPVASLQFDNEERAKRIQDSLGRAAFGPERIKEILMQLKGLSFLANGGRVGYQAGGVATPEQYAAALQKVGGGTEADKQRSLGNYLGDYIATQGQKLGNAAIIPLQAAKGILGIQGTPMTSSMQSALQNIIQNQIKNTGQLSGNINYKDYGVQTSTGAEFEGFGNRSITDPESALATTLGRASYTVDPTTGKVNFTGGTAYDFRDDQFGGLGKFISKGGAFGSKPTEYKPEISLQSEFLKPYQQATNSSSVNGYSAYQGILPGYKYNQTLDSYMDPSGNVISRGGYYNAISNYNNTTSSIPQFYQNNPGSYDFDKFKEAYAFATGQQNLVSRNPDGQIVTNFGNWDPSNTYGAYMSDTGTSNSNPFFSQFRDPNTFNKNTLISMYGAPGAGKAYYADGGLATMFSEKR